MLWTYSDEIDTTRLESWVNRAGLMQEWQAFAALAVKHLGMPVGAMPFFNVNLNLDDNANLDDNLDLDVNLDEKLKRKAEQLLSFILSSGNKHKVRDTFVLAKIFPSNTIKFLPSIFLNVNGLKVMERIFVVKRNCGY